MAVSTTYPVQLNFTADNQVARWRPLVQWLLAIPHFAVASVLTSLRRLLTLISFVTVLFTKRIPRPLFDAIAMTYRYEWRATSYALFLHESYPPFDFQPTASDDGATAHTAISFTYPEELSRWKPLYKWLLAIPHYVVMLALSAASIAVILFGLIAVIVTGAYPVGARDFLVGVYRYGVRVQAYVGLLTDTYPPFTVGS
jgi:roadblock/LC7 domain-containing protein